MRSEEQYPAIMKLDKKIQGFSLERKTADYMEIERDGDYEEEQNI